MTTYTKNNIKKLENNGNIQDTKVLLNILKYVDKVNCSNIYTNSFKARMFGLLFYDLINFDKLDKKTALLQIKEKFSELKNYSKESLMRIFERYYKLTNECVSSGRLLSNQRNIKYSSGYSAVLFCLVQNNFYHLKDSNGNYYYTCP